jgi:hypothetical protein
VAGAHAGAFPRPRACVNHVTRRAVLDHGRLSPSPLSDGMATVVYDDRRRPSSGQLHTPTHTRATGGRGDMRHWHALRRSDRGSRRSRRRRVASRYQGVTLREKHRCGHHFSRLPGACALHACLCSMSRYFESLRSTRSQPVIKYPARENIHRMAYFLYLRAHRPANTRREAG